MTTQAENKLRVRKAVGWILQGHSVPRCGQAGRIRGVSRRTARRIAGKAMDLVHKDLEATNVENPQMATVLIHNLQECMARGMESNNIGAAVAAARAERDARDWKTKYEPLTELLEAVISHNERKFEGTCRVGKLYLEKSNAFLD